jgi:hypothetical protein
MTVPQKSRGKRALLFRQRQNRRVELHKGCIHCGIRFMAAFPIGAVCDLFTRASIVETEKGLAILEP